MRFYYQSKLILSSSITSGRFIIRAFMLITYSPINPRKNRTSPPTSTVVMIIAAAAVLKYSGLHIFKTRQTSAVSTLPPDISIPRNVAARTPAFV